MFCSDKSLCKEYIDHSCITIVKKLAEVKEERIIRTCGFRVLWYVSKAGRLWWNSRVYNSRATWVGYLTPQCTGQHRLEQWGYPSTPQ